MKTITAIIRPAKLSEVHDALNGVEIEMLAVTRVMGCGRNDNGTAPAASAEVNLLNKTRIEIMVADHLVKKTVEIIIRKSRTGAHGDGKIFVMDAPQFQNISTSTAAAGALA